MTEELKKDMAGFYVVGINYKKTDAATRGLFSVCNESYDRILTAAPSYFLSELFVLSTCNRTEIYGFAENSSVLIDLLCQNAAGSKKIFQELCYIKNGNEAIQHLFEVGSGLESQILGDYEIIGQLKLAVKFSKKHGFIGSFLERLINSVIQSTKEIKNQTALSSGTVSVSFAAVQYIKNSFSDIANKQIVLVGTGKIGSITCKNLCDYVGTKNITLVNRTKDKAEELANKMGLCCASLEDLPNLIDKADIVLVATNSPTPTVLTNHLVGKGKKLVIDLSVPYNVEESAAHLPNVTLINVDELSKLKDETLQKRMAEVPKAKAIIEEQITEFAEWSDMRKNVPYIKAVKQKLHDMQKCDLYQSIYHQCTSTEEKTLNDFAIQKAVKNMALKMKLMPMPGCNYIEAINDFITTDSN